MYAIHIGEGNIDVNVHLYPEGSPLPIEVESIDCNKAGVYIFKNPLQKTLQVTLLWVKSSSQTRHLHTTSTAVQSSLQPALLSARMVSL